MLLNFLIFHIMIFKMLTGQMFSQIKSLLDIKLHWKEVITHKPTLAAGTRVGTKYRDITCCLSDNVVQSK